jgi:hypothetical protein
MLFQSTLSIPAPVPNQTMQTDGWPALAFASQFSIRFAERNRAFDIAARIQNPNLS